MSAAARAKEFLHRWMSHVPPDMVEALAGEFDAFAAEQTARAEALVLLVREYLEAEGKSMSAAQCEDYGIPFTEEIADANVRVASLRKRLDGFLGGTT